MHGRAGWKRSALKAAGLVAIALGSLFLLAQGASADVPGSRAPYEPSEITPVAPSPVRVPATSMSTQPAPTEPGDADDAAPAGEPTVDDEVAAPPADSDDLAPEPSGEPAESEPDPGEVAAVLAAAPPATAAGEPPATRTGSGDAEETATVDAAPGVTQKAADAITSGLLRVRGFLQEISGACQIGAPSGPGAPALTFAVLGVAAVFGRDWSLRARWPGDEDVPELLYAKDVIAPG